MRTLAAFALAISALPAAVFAQHEITGCLAGKSMGLARAAGLIEKEKALDAMFSRATVSRDSLKKITAAIGAPQARIRLTHLEAHLALRSTLTPAQIETYQTLRGYAAAPSATAAADRP